MPWHKKMLDRWELILALLAGLAFVVRKDQKIDDAITLGQETATRVDSMRPVLAKLEQGQEDIIDFLHVKRRKHGVVVVKADENGD